MGILKDINNFAKTVGEARRATKAIVELSNLKAQLKALKEERDQERKRRQELEAGIQKHKKSMEDCPRSWESDQELWRLVDK